MRKPSGPFANLFTPLGRGAQVETTVMSTDLSVDGFNVVDQWGLGGLEFGKYGMEANPMAALRANFFGSHPRLLTLK